MYDICCIGHISSDKIVTPRSVNYLPGGTAYYFSCALSKLNINYLLVTSLGAAEMHYADDLRAQGIRVKVQPGNGTVYFENIYGENQDHRTQNVLQTADAFTMEQPEDVDAQIFHLGPLLADDIPVELIKTLSAKGLVSLDVQGYLRKVENQKVYPAGWPQKKEALKHVTILKADVAELRALTGPVSVNKGAELLADWGVKEVVITDGSKGSVIFCEGAFHTIPAYPSRIVADATGCGDTYMAGYLFRRIKGDDARQAGAFAAAMAGLKIAAAGPFTGDENDVISFLKGGG